jgi:hypothetical protein
LLGVNVYAAAAVAAVGVPETVPVATSITNPVGNARERENEVGAGVQEEGTKGVMESPYPKEMVEGRVQPVTNFGFTSITTEMGVAVP